MIFNESGETFLDKARYQVVFKGEAIKGSAKDEAIKPLPCLMVPKSLLSLWEKIQVTASVAPGH